MYTLKITDDNDNTTFYRLKKCQISIENNILYLSLYTEDETIVYEIKADNRAKDLTIIKDYLVEQTAATFNGKQPLSISEFFERQYIFVGNDDNKQQYTARKQ